VVVDDHARKTPGEAGGELLDHAAVLFAKHIQAAVQVNRWQARVRRYVREQAVKLVRSVGVRLGCQAFLGEAEACEPEQRVIAGVPLLEQGMDRAMTGSRTIHNTPSAIHAALPL
jgi:hypothetical protein